MTIPLPSQQQWRCVSHQNRGCPSLYPSLYETAISGFGPNQVLAAEYKRRQAAPGPRITRKAFGRDHRYPITSGWRDSGVFGK